MEQDFTNYFEGVKNKPYMLIAAAICAQKYTTLSGRELFVTDLKKELGYSQLIDWNANSKELLQWVDYIRNNPQTECRLVIDSGAYSMWSKGITFDIDKYINFLNSNNVIETCFWAAEADVIPGNKYSIPTHSQVEEAAEQSWKNYLYMIDRVKIPKKIVPIFHQDEPFDCLKRILEYRFKDGDHIPYIGLGCHGVSDAFMWYEQVHKIIKESSNPNVKIHNFGLTVPEFLETFPSFSSDSTTWFQSACHGNISIFKDGHMSCVYVGKSRNYNKQHYDYLSEAKKEYIRDYIIKIGGPYGFTPEDIINNEKVQPLILFNLLSFNYMKNNLKIPTNYNVSLKHDLW